MTFDPYEIVLTLLGVVGLVAAVLPPLLHDRPVSLPMLLVALGALLFVAVPVLEPPDLGEELQLTERLTEFGVIVSLLASGLAINRPLGLRSWAPTWRLLAVTMPLGIAATAVIGVAGLGLPLATAVLLGAALAPTDPVVADELAVDEPAGSPSGEDDVRATLTSEAGLNDALAFPFVYLALTLNGIVGPGDIATWFGVDLVLRIVIGLAAGVACGYGVQWLAFRLPHDDARLARNGEGFVALAFLFLSYGVAELLHGYGFLAVFVAAVTFRSGERHHQYHGALHTFTQQIERLAVIILLVLFGGALVGGLLDAVTWPVVVTAVVLVAVVRPATALLALLGSYVTRPNRAIIAFYGVRGIGSIYYVAYALGTESFAEAPTLWATVAVTILVSIVVHGATEVTAQGRIDVRRTFRRSSSRGAVRVPLAARRSGPLP
jgi:NhaP-type Na+/H+ or K+/H+ antiporter